MLPWVANMSKRPRHSTIPQVSGPTVLIMAAGEGTRMRSSVPKMLHPVCGRPMVAWPVLAAREAGAERVCVIVSPARDLSSALPEGTETAVQTHSDGTGGAVRAALGVIQGSDTVIVMNGDHPLVTPEALEDTYRAHTDSGAAATVVSVEREDAESLGRVVRDANGDFERIVETKYPEGVPAEILAIHEVNTNTFAFDAEALADALGRITSDNSAREYYIGDALQLMREDGKRVIVHKVDDISVNIGVNNRAELATVNEIARQRINERHMLDGVTLTDPASTWIDADVEIEPDTVIEPGTTLRGRTRIGGSSIIGPHTTIIDSTVGSQVDRPALLRHRQRDRRRLQRRARSPTCGPAPCSPRGRRPAPSSSSRTRRSAGGRRCRTCRTSATRTSATRRTSGRRRSPPTTTDSANTARRSGTECTHPLTRPWSLR